MTCSARRPSAALLAAPAEAAAEESSPRRPPAPVHKYAIGYEYVNNHGGNSWLNLWSPAVNVGANQVFSLSQEWYIGGSNASTQTAEGGWQVFPNKYGSSHAALFIYWTANNYVSTGCYNLDCAAFVQVNSDWALGGTFSGYSMPGGQQVGFQLQWSFDGANWWLFLQASGKPEAIGYYPATIYQGGQLSHYSTLVEYGGEAVGTRTWPNMGSGAFARTGFQHAAFQRLIFYIDTNQASQWTNLTPLLRSPRCYTLIFTPAMAGSSWGAYFYFGGPGGRGC